MGLPLQRFFTQAEYLEREDKAEFKSQYIDGEIFEAQGAQPWHVGVVGNLVGMLHHRLQPRLDCHFYTSSMRVRVEAAELLTYPDVAALRGEPRFEHLANSANLLNPQVIFEVFSSTTETFDRGDKFRCYRRLESLTDYVLVASERWWVEHHYFKENGVWVCDEYTHPASRFHLASLDCELPLAKIYEGVTFPTTL